MTSTAQRAELQNKIWRIANDVRGSVDGWDFKQFVLGTLFYRFISENFTNYIEGGEEGIEYAKLSDDVITPEIKDDAIKTKGYFIYPSQLFVNVAKKANTNPNLNTDLKSLYDAIESSANGYPSEPDIKGLFADFDTTSTRLGNTVESKNNTLAKVLKGIEELDFGNFENNEIDLFGDAYEFLISNYAANAGKSGGEFFTPQHVSKLIAQLAMHKQDKVNKIYDPAAGSGSLLLQAKKHFDNHIIEEGFYGQEVNHTTYNLARMNMFLHNINYDKFNIALGDTLRNPYYGDEKPFDAIVSNPPYSINWIGDGDPTLINDDRFAPAGVLAPKSKADFAFVLHALSYLSSKGRAAIVCFPGIFYRSGSEQKIRKYLVDNNYVETIISLAPNLFYGTSIAVNILVLSKHKTENKTQFIDASGEDFFKKITNNNVLTDKHIEKIMELFDSKESIDYVAKTIENSLIVANDYNLSVSTYVTAKDKNESVDIIKLNSDISKTVEKINALRLNFDSYQNELLHFKDDEVKWKTLGEVAVFRRGSFPQPYGNSEWYDGEGAMPFVQVVDVGHDMKLVRDTKNKISKLAQPKSVFVPKGTVIVTLQGSIGRVAITQYDSYVDRTLAIFEQFQIEIDKKYFAYQLQEKFRIEKETARGDIIKTITKEDFKKFQIPIPSLKVQKETVRILDTLTEQAEQIRAELMAELTAREKQFEYFRDILLNFSKINVES